MVRREFSIDNLLEVLPNVSETVMEALQGLELAVDPCGEGADGDVTDVSEKVFYTYFFCFFGFND